MLCAPQLQFFSETCRRRSNSSFKRLLPRGGAGDASARQAGRGPEPSPAPGLKQVWANAALFLQLLQSRSCFNWIDHHVCSLRELHCNCSRLPLTLASHYLASKVCTAAHTPNIGQLPAELLVKLLESAVWIHACSVQVLLCRVYGVLGGRQAAWIQIGAASMCCQEQQMFEGGRIEKTFVVTMRSLSRLSLTEVFLATRQTFVPATAVHAQKPLPQYRGLCLELCVK